MKLCITEKPSVARDIANILGASSRHDGYFEGNGYRVSWTFGHLCCLKEPQDYTDNWKRWSLGALPMIPPRFGIKLLPDKGIAKQFHILEGLIAEADEIINCGDAGQEGELIQRWVMQKAGVKCPVSRLWISSLTDAAIRQGFKDLKPEKDYELLYHAGLSRAIGDWVLGINATRLYSLKYSRPGEVLSVGRVQTPTLALVVARQREIDNFVPADFFELSTTYREVNFSSTAGRFDSMGQAQAVADAIAPFPLHIDKVTGKTATEAPPQLFDLTSLQVESNKKWGWSADKTLKLIQSLYEKKTVTYPRVDTVYLPEDVYPKIPEIMRGMTPYAALTAPVLGKKIPKSKKVFDNARITDHHAIIPTGQSPSALVGDEKLLYHLIARRFIAAFYPPAKFSVTTVEASVKPAEPIKIPAVTKAEGEAGVSENGPQNTGSDSGSKRLKSESEVKFKANGRVMLDPGWKAIYDKEGDDTVLPEFKEGEEGPHKPSVTKKTTTPPKPYTEGTLLRAMETAGKSVDDPELRESLKENGIGRPSTRSAIIETLFKRKYLERKRKSIFPTQAGCDLIDIISEPLLKSAALTGIWENKLRRIERGTYQAASFIDEIKKLISGITVNVLADNSLKKIK